MEKKNFIPNISKYKILRLFIKKHFNLKKNNNK